MTNFSIFRCRAALGWVSAAVAALLASAAAAAQPEPWQIGLQPAASEIMEEISWFNSFTLIIITVITLFVTALLAWCVVRFRREANPTPSRTTHHTLIEVIWTVVPILILVVIAIPSFRLLYRQLEIPPADLTVKVTGYQWYWGYEYTDEEHAGVSFDSLLLSESREVSEKASAQGLAVNDLPRLLAVDNDLVVPVGKVIRVQVTAADVLHAFTVPAFGFKIDAVPGRLNETWFRADREGIYYGQCSELCGKDHAYMPIGVRVVSEEKFNAFIAAAQEDLDGAYRMLAGTGSLDTSVAALGKAE